MKNKYIVLGLALILVLPLLVSCGGGISQEQYDQVNSNLATAQAQVQSLQSDLSAAQAQIKQLQDDLDAARDQNQNLQDKMKVAKSKIEVVNAIFLPALKGEFDNMTDVQIMNLFLGWRDQIVDIGDASLTAKFQAIIDSNGGDAETLAFFLFLFEGLSKTLE